MRRVVRVDASIEILAAPDRVWAFVWSAESNLILTGVVRAFTVPGTPKGSVGEQQCYISKDERGLHRCNLIEVIELGPGYRAVTQSLTITPRAWTTTVVTELPHGCLLTCGHEVEVSAFRVSAWRKSLAEGNDEYLKRVKAAVEANTAVP